MNVSLPRIGGAAGAVGGALWSIKVVLDGPDPSGTGLDDVLLFLLPILFGAGLAGLYAKYSGDMAGEGNAGFVQSFAGLTMLSAGLFADLTLGLENTTRIISFGFIILTLGLVILGFAMLKNEPLPLWNFLPLVLGLLTPLNLIVGDAPFIRLAISAAFGLGWLALGTLVFLDRREPETKQV
ncbi:MAG: hypothetical protein WA982_03150 [Rubrobacteraceae bacterium]